MSARYLIKGGMALKGEIKVAGNKNAILPIIAATLLTDEECLIENVPKISDVTIMGELLKDLGAKVEGLGTEKLIIKTAGVKKHHLKPELVQKLRASILFMGPLLARFRQARLKHPGGCLIGKRAVGTHFEALRALGAEVFVGEGDYEGKLIRGHASRIFLDEASVTATENTIMLASLIPGTTVIENAACEPHVRNLAQFLVKMGARIEGFGTNRLNVYGVKKLGGAAIKIIPDYMEIGTFAIAAAVTKGEILIKDTIPGDLDMIMLYLKRMGVDLRLVGNDLLIKKSKLKAPRGKIQTRPWPGFPTDLMSPLIVLATQAKGATLCHDWMYETRMFFIDKLTTMGADITICDPHRVLVNGPTPLQGKILESPDIRAGMALVLASLCARGESIIENIQLIERGYQEPHLRLRSLGAEIRKVNGKKSV
ncbi:MAG TPA: UDP-N-acetylglucosamine 1-carboxyvinyltransferase [Candidatus Bathyarchaeia archaeon]|nr:UDP-N-acetylglucosamine 1-carboxyvinyltransferase [Candidatus Bathyarchaeia archaeon]